MSARAKVAVDFFADLSCPWCYVGWAALKQAAGAESARVATSVAWRTFLLSPDLPAEGLDRKAFLSAHYTPEQIAAAHRALEEAASEAGAPIALAKVSRIPNTIDAHRLVHWAADDGLAEPAIDAVFEAHFAQARDISARDVLLACAETAGLDTVRIGDWLASEKDRDMVLELHGAAVKAGVAGVPVAIFGRKLPLMGAQTPQVYAQALSSAAR